MDETSCVASTLAHAARARLIDMIQSSTWDWKHHDSRLVDRTCRVPDEVSDNIFDVIAPIEPWPRVLFDTRSDATYAILVGAAASLLQAKSLLELPTDWPPRRYDHALLMNDLRNAQGRAGLINWDHSPNLLDWSAGYFVNRAEHNIAAAFDRCLGAWVVSGLGLDLADPRKAETWMGGWPVQRLQVLLAIANKNNAKLINDLLLSFVQDNLGDTECAADWIADSALRAFENRGDDTQFLLVARRAINHIARIGSIGLAVATARTNSFKHHFEGREAVLDYDIGRKKRLCFQYVVTEQAFYCLGKIWRAMLSEMQEEAARS